MELYLCLSYIPSWRNFFFSPLTQACTDKPCIFFQIPSKEVAYVGGTTAPLLIKVSVPVFFVFLALLPSPFVLAVWAPWPLTSHPQRSSSEPGPFMPAEWHASCPDGQWPSCRNRQELNTTFLLLRDYDVKAGWATSAGWRHKGTPPPATRSILGVLPVPLAPRRHHSQLADAPRPDIFTSSSCAPFLVSSSSA